MNAQTKPAVTPGPWGIDRRDREVHVVGRPAWGCKRFGVVGVWTVAVLDDLAGDKSRRSEMNANARLIADAGTVLHETGKSPSELAAEVERLERAGAAAFEAMRKSQAEVERLTTQVESLTVEVEEESHIQGRMAQLLAGAIVAIRGPEPELTRWGYHDLPERVRDVVAQRDALLGALDNLLENTESPPERNCSCHISPPCNDCTDWSCLREAIAIGRAAIHQCEGAKA